MKIIRFIFPILLFIYSTEARIIQHHSITNHLNTGRFVVFDIERDDEPTELVKFSFFPTPKNTQNDSSFRMENKDSSYSFPATFEDRLHIRIQSTNIKPTILETRKKLVYFLWDSEKKVPSETPLRMEVLNFKNMENGKFAFLLKVFHLVDEPPSIILAVWEPTGDRGYRKKFEREIWTAGCLSDFQDSRFSTINGNLYAVLRVTGEKGYEFWRLDDSDAIQEDQSPISIPSKWQSMINRLISVTTNGLSKGYSFVTEVERNYNWATTSENENWQVQGQKNRLIKKIVKCDGITYTLVVSNEFKTLTAWDKFTWTIFGPDGEVVRTRITDCPYYSAQSLFWPYADTDPDRILDVYRNAQGIIYVISDRFDGFAVFAYQGKWNKLNIETCFGPTFRKPVSSAKFHPVGTNLFLRVNYENGTTDFWKITGLDAEKVKTPFEFSKVRE